MSNHNPVPRNVKTKLRSHVEMKLRQLLRDVCRDRGWSASDLGRNLFGDSPATKGGCYTNRTRGAQLLSGARTPTLYTAVRIFKALGLSLDEVFLND